MAKNRVEKHIQAGAFFTFKVAAGQNIKIGQLVELTGNREVSVAGAASSKVVGVCYSGTVGIDGVNDGYVGDNGDVVTIVVLKPLVYLEANGAIAAGDLLASSAGGTVVAGGTGDTLVGHAVEDGTDGQRILVLLGK